MIIADLDYLESISQETSIGVSASAGVTVDVFGKAIGKIASTWADTKTIAITLPSGDSIAIGLGLVVAIAFTPASPR
jgi:hypothetical protein